MSHRYDREQSQMEEPTLAPTPTPPPHIPAWLRPGLDQAQRAAARGPMMKRLEKNGLNVSVVTPNHSADPEHAQAMIDEMLLDGWSEYTGPES